MTFLSVLFTFPFTLYFLIVMLWLEAKNTLCTSKYLSGNCTGPITVVIQMLARKLTS